MSDFVRRTSDAVTQRVKGSKMKVTKKPVRRKIVVALLGMCLAVSSYTIPTSEASATQEQVTPAVQSAAGTTTVHTAPGSPQSQIVPFWNPFCPFYYSYYSYYYYYYYYYYYPYFVFYYY